MLRKEGDNYWCNGNKIKWDTSISLSFTNLNTDCFPVWMLSVRDVRNWCEAAALPKSHLSWDIHFDIWVLGDYSLSHLLFLKERNLWTEFQKNRCGHGQVTSPPTCAWSSFSHKFHQSLPDLVPDNSFNYSNS